MLRTMLLSIGLLLGPAAVAQQGASAWPERVRSAGAVDAWSAIGALRASGTLAVGGLEGEFHSLENARDGRSSSRYTLGPIEGGQGYDGAVAWSRTGAETIVADGEEARKNAVTSAWLAHRGYLDDAGVEYGAPRSERADGIEYAVLDATPSGGATVELWFDARSALLARSVLQVAQDRQVTRYEDYRSVADVPLPFRIVSDGNDPRNRTVVQFASIEAVATPDDIAFARPTAAAEDFAFTDGGHRATLPFDLLNNHIYVDGRIDGKPVRLLFDTGGLNLLTPQAVARLGLTSEGRMAARGVGEQQVDVGFARAGQMELGALRLDAPLFYVMDLGDLPKVEGFAFDGLIGYEIFHRLAVQIDYAGERLTFTHPDHYRAPVTGSTLDFTLDGRIPVVQGEIAGIPSRFSIDTGSRSSLSLHSPFVREHGLLQRFGACFDAVVGWGVGGESRGSPARIDIVKLGDVAVGDVLADLTTGDKGAFANPDISANVGSGLLRRFVVDFDYRARRIHLAPGRDHGRRDDHDRAGMWLLLDGEALQVTAITEGGAAQRAGVQVGDRIVAVDGDAVRSRSLMQWRSLLRETDVGTRLVLRIERGGRQLDAPMTLIDRLAACSKPS
jgi:hypothetical protein